MALLPNILRGIAKLSLPIWGRLMSTAAHKPLSGRADGIIVSLTTIPSRIDKLNLVIESMFRQTIVPDKIVLTLSEPEFPTGTESLPKSLQKYIKLGLEVVFIPEDLKSHKKYYHSFAAYPDSRVITIDDDCWYLKDTIERLIKLGEKQPDCVIANSVTVIRPGLCYREWKKAHMPLDPSHSNLAVGNGGVLYPRNFVSRCMAHGNNVLDKESFMTLTPLADDLWLKANEMASGIKVAGTGTRFIPITIIGTQKLALRKVNLGSENRNDTQWQALELFFSQRDRLVADERTGPAADAVDITDGKRKTESESP